MPTEPFDSIVTYALPLFVNNCRYPLADELPIIELAPLCCNNKFALSVTKFISAVAELYMDSFRDGVVVAIPTLPLFNILILELQEEVSYV